MRRWWVLPVLVLVAVPSAALAGGGGACRAPTGEGTGRVVEMAKSCFAPEVLRVEPGTEVIFVNRDPYPHTVTGAGLAWGSVADLPHDRTTKVRFDEPGVYPYMCALHPGMAGAVIVGEAAGARSLPGGPPGLVAAAALVLAGAAGLARLVRGRRRVVPA